MYVEGEIVVPTPTHGAGNHTPAPHPYPLLHPHEANMIYIDDREGSKELYGRFLKKYPQALVRLEYADVMFEGLGPAGRVDVGVERKVITDLLSSISTGRLTGHQLPGMAKDYYKSYLIVEGKWKAGGDGVIEILRKGRWESIQHGRRFKYMEVMAYLNSLTMLGGIGVWFTGNMAETIATIQALFGWWQKDWEQHKSHLEMHKPAPPTAFLNPDGPSLLRRMAMELPGIGWERTKQVEVAFPTIVDMVNATQEEWEGVGGIGKVIARTVYEALRKGR